MNDDLVIKCGVCKMDYSLYEGFTIINWHLYQTINLHTCKE